MLALRSIGLTLFLGWHVVAGGVGSLLHTCAMAAEERATSCKCRHSQSAPADADQVRRADCCSEELVRAGTEPAVREGARALELQLAAPALPAPAIAMVDETSHPSQVEAWRTGPPSQGPPLYLKVRTLLI